MLTQLPRPPVLRAHSYSSTTTWRTQDEVHFLDRLGEHTEGRRKVLRASDRIRLLRGYLSSMKLRRLWRNLEKETIRRHAETLIESYTALSKTKGS